MTTIDKVNIGIIGCGRISGHHCRSVLDLDNVELTAVCDLIGEKAEAYSKEFGIDWYTNYREMLEEHPEINTVVIATPSGMHYEHGLELVQKYKKNLIVEKPTFMRPDQLNEVFDAAEENGVKIFPVFQNRYNKAVTKVKDELDNGQLGEIRIISVRVRWCRPQRYYDLAEWRGTFSHDGGALTNQGIHHVDLLRYLGGEVGFVNSTMRTLGADIEVEDTVVATLKYSTGAVGSVEVTTAARPDDFEASISIVGSEGLAEVGGIAVNELKLFSPDPQCCDEFSEDFSQGIGVYGNGHQKMYIDIAESLLHGKEFPVSRSDCLNTVTLLNSFYASDEKQNWIDISDFESSIRLGREDDKISNLYRT